jgi:hypothetical protein
MVASSTSLDELRQRVQAKGIKMETTTNKTGEAIGLRFGMNGFRFKGSELDRGLSLGQIGQRLRHNHDQGRKKELGLKQTNAPQIEDKRYRGPQL